MGLVFKYGEQQDAIKFLPPDRTDGLEFWITNKIREIRDKGDDIQHKIGVLTGHDEIKLSDNNLVPTQHGQVLDAGHHHAELPLLHVPGRGPEGRRRGDPTTLDGLIITQPGKDLTEKELRRIDQFVMKGKALAVFASAVNVKADRRDDERDAQPHGLDKLLEGYGIAISKDVVLDFWRHARHRRADAWAAWPASRCRSCSRCRTTRASRATSSSSTRRSRACSASRTSRRPSRRASSSRPTSSRGATMKVVARSSPFAVHLTGETRRPARPSAAQGVGAEAQGPAAGAVRHRRERRGHAQERVPRPATSRASRRRRRAPSRRACSCSRRRSSSRTRSRARATAPDMGQYGAMMPNLGGDEQLLMLAGPVRAAVRHRVDPRVQEHARLAHGRHRPPRRQREDPRGPEPRLRRHQAQVHPGR